MNLNNLQVNKLAKISKINAEGETIIRLNDLGVTVGSKIKVVRKSLFNSPIEVEIKNYRLALRKDLASKIEVNYE